MTLSPRTRLGPYEIVSPLGAGGMGEVYRATDTRLSRPVAIKVLPSHLSTSPELRERFEREARAISSLSHAHICTLYDVGHQDGIDYLVMEYLEGETLDKRLVKGPLPPDQVLQYGIQIAEALDKAHRQGIVHRDLKPGNVMLTKSGTKLLDFGLAKLKAPGAAPVASAFTALPTQERPLTAEGSIVGTFQYMAPEQLEGKEPDARTDIFALGAVLYEMATGRKAFSGKSQASLIAAILASEPPPISSLQPLTPPALDRVVRTCLAKDPDDRWQNAHDLVSELKWIQEAGSQAGVPAPVVARRKSRERLAWGLAAAATIALLALIWREVGREAPRMVQSSVLPPADAAFQFNTGPMALSPDGRRLAFIARADGKDSLWVRPLSGLSAQRLAGTEGATLPFWSPDSRFLGFFADGKLKKIEASGGPPQGLCDAPASRGGSWGREDVIVFAPEITGPLHRVPASGAASAPVTQLDAARGEASHRWPVFLPDGKHFLYLSRGSPGVQSEGNAVYVASLDSRPTTLLFQADSNVAYAPPGYLLFHRDGSLLAQPFDAGELRLTGHAVPVAEQVQNIPVFPMAIFSVSESGILAYQQGGRVLTQPIWFDRTGKQIEAVGSPGDFILPRLSHDGRRLGVSVLDPRSGNADIWLHDLSRRVATRFTFDAADDRSSVWSPDDSRIAFSSRRKGRQDLYQKVSTGGASEELVFSSESQFKFVTSWSRDGRTLIFHSTGGKTSSDLWTLSLADGKANVFLQTPYAENDGQFSPDGRWIAYVSNESGKSEVYVQPFPGPGGKWQVSPGGGSMAKWRDDGKELYYLAPDRKLMAVDVSLGSTFVGGVPRPLFETRIRVGPNRQYDVSADGRRFLINTVVGEENAAPITLVQNWTAGLNR